MKRCPGCGNDFPLERFGVRQRHPDGTVKSRQSRCPICRAEERMLWARRKRNAPTPVDAEQQPWLAIGPWRAWLTARLEREQRHGGDTMSLSTSLGVTDRRLHAWLREAGRVRLDNVDAALCHAGEPGLLGELYPELYAFEDAA